MTEATCRHLDTSPEAYRIDAVTGERTPATVYFCQWPDAHPDRFMNAPRWLTEWALSGGPSFMPAKHCVGCPGYERAPHEREDEQ